MTRRILARRTSGGDDYVCAYPWPCSVLCGDRAAPDSRAGACASNPMALMQEYALGMSGDAGHTTAYFEAIPGSGVFVRAEAPTVEEAEARAWEEFYGASKP